LAQAVFKDSHRTASTTPAMLQVPAAVCKGKLGLDRRPSAEMSEASTNLGDSDVELCSPCSAPPAAEPSTACQVVVRSTFLDVEECPPLSQRVRTLRRAKTESDLGACDGQEIYEPGRFSDERKIPASSTPAESSSGNARKEDAEPKARQQLCLETALRCDASEGGTPVDGNARRTTVMLRNVPNNYTREMMLTLLDDCGFRARYDFMYLPCDFNRKANLGYAFVNFVSAEAAIAAWRCFDGFAAWALPSQKVCRVSWSEPHQGLEEHIERYRNSPVMHKSVPDEYRPLVLLNGVRQQFPEPTKSIKKPDQSRNGGR